VTRVVATSQYNNSDDAAGCAGFPQDRSDCRSGCCMGPWPCETKNDYATEVRAWKLSRDIQDATSGDGMTRRGIMGEA